MFPPCGSSTPTAKACFACCRKCCLQKRRAQPGRCLRALSVDKDSMCITTALVGNLAGACSCLCLQSILSSVLWKPLRQGSPTRPSSRCPQEPPQTAKSLCNSFGARQPGSPLCNWADRDTECFGQAPLLCFALFRSSRRRSSPLLPLAHAAGTRGPSVDSAAPRVPCDSDLL